MRYVVEGGQLFYVEHRTGDSTEDERGGESKSSFIYYLIIDPYLYIASTSTVKRKWLF